jgi:hypothetical protein
MPGLTQQHLGRPTGYDVFQVCENGHPINGGSLRRPERNAPYCVACGAKALTKCPECQSEIRGDYHYGGGSYGYARKPPNNCHSCSVAYPWRQQELAAAIEILQMDMDPDAAATIPALLRDVATETPRTQLAAIKLARLLPAVGKATYDIAIKVVSDLASETAKKALGLETPKK